MDLSGVALYWLSRSGESPPAAWRGFDVQIAPPAQSAPTPLAVFLTAPLEEISSACADIRRRLGPDAYIVFVSNAAAERIAALIGRDIDEACAPDSLERPMLLLARVKARALERRQAAQSLAELERRCAQIQAGIDALPTPIFIKDAEARYSGCNQAFQRFLGLPAAAIIGKSVYDVSPAEFAERYEAADRALLESGGEQIYEASVRHADGSRHEVMFHKAVFRNDDGAIAGMAGVMLDIDQRKRAEAALNESEQRYRDVFEHASDCIALIDVTPDGRYILAAANPAARRACGLPADAQFDAPLELTLSAASAAPFVERLAESAAAQTTIRYQTSFAGPSGFRTFVVNLVPVVATGKATRRVIAIARDVTDEREVERLRSESERDFRTLVENSPDAIIRYDRAGRCVYANRAVDLHQRNAPQSMLGKTPTEIGILGDPEQDRLYQDWLLAVMEAGESDEKQFSFPMPGGEPRIAVVRAIPERGANGDVLSVLSVGTDADERVRAEKQLRQRELEFRTLVENSPDFVMRYDAECRRIYVNPAARKAMGLDKAAIGATPRGGPVLDIDRYVEALRGVLKSGREAELECAYVAHDGAIKQGHIRMVPEFDATDKIVGALAVGRDITEIVESRRKIQRLAFYDSLTDLPNRALLGERVGELTARPDGGGAFALMLLDLDRFKEVNDTFGHAVGDELLCKVAARLRRCIRRSDTISRLGGDEFAILLPNVAKDRDFAAIAAKILGAFAKPFILSGREIGIYASIGVAETSGEPIDVDTLLKRADSAMYHAKRMGRNNFQFFTPAMTARNVWRMAVETNLRKAISRGELDLYLQPLVSLNNREILGAETLLRWRHGELGFLTPDKFVSIAEESGQIVDIGRWVLAEACRRVVKWNKIAPAPLQVAVNLSGRQFVMSDVVGALREILKESGCRPDWLELEITESLLLEDNQSVRTMLESIRDMGVSIAIDDFGTGFSALSYLTRFPISTLKIDRSFINDVDRDQKRAELVKAIIGISQALELKLIAEGVESEAQVEFLLRAGCKEAQGFLFGRPMPDAEFAGRLDKERRQPGPLARGRRALVASRGVKALVG